MLVNLESRRKNPEAEVLGCLEHGSSNLTGFFHIERNRYVVYPEDPRFPFTITLDQLPKTADKPEIGDVVIVRLDEKKSTPSSVRGKIIEILGNPDLPEVQIRMVAEKYGLPGKFSPEALQDATQAETAPEPAEREDLRDILHYTIDGEDAKDFDDAIAVLKMGHGYRLYVSIADVAAYVIPGSRLDIEAYERGTSTYFPGFVAAHAAGEPEQQSLQPDGRCRPPHHDGGTRLRPAGAAAEKAIYQVNHPQQDAVYL